MTAEEYEDMRRTEEANRSKAAPSQQRLFPASEDAEGGVIGSILIQPDLLDVFREQGVSADCFHNPAKAIVYAELQAMGAAQEPIDIVTVTQWLEDRKLLANAGGAAKISEFFTFLPTAANAEYYGEILLEKHWLREAIRFGTEIVGRCYDEQGELSELRASMERGLSMLLDPATTKHRRKDMRQMVLEVVNMVTAGDSESVWGIPTGFPNLDAIARGLRKGNMIVIGGETSSGKTSLALNILSNVCVRGIKKPEGIERHLGLIFSLEMTSSEVTESLLQIGSGINIDTIIEGRANAAEIESFTTQANRLADAPLIIRDETELDILQIRSIARRLKPRLIVLDYAQLAKGSKKRYDRADLEVAEISRSCKLMAGELDATVILISQLNDDGKVAGSRSLAKDANQFWIVEDGGEGEKVVKVCKQRRGARDEARMRWIGPAQKFLPRSA